MDLTQIFGNLPVVLIPIALVVYYTNQNNIKWMAERNELLKALAIERKEWLDWQAATIERLFNQQEARSAIQERLAVAIQDFKGELHAVRGKIQELMLRYEVALMPKQDKRSGASDDR